MAELIREGLPADLALLGGALAVGLLAGVGGALVCATRPGSLAARGLEAAAVLAICAPVYVVGLTSLLLFGADIALVELPVGIPVEYMRPSDGAGRWIGSPLVPWVVLGLPLAGLCLRGMRGGLRELAGEEFVRAAVA